MTTHIRQRVKVKPGLLIQYFLIGVVMVVLHLSMALAQPPLEGSGSGLVGWWRFDEGGGLSVTDSSGNGNTGTLMGNPAWVSGISGNALRFNGLTDYIRIPNSTSLSTGVMTVAMWVNVSDFLKSSPSFFAWGGNRGSCQDTYRTWYLPSGAIQASYQNVASSQVIRGAALANSSTVKLGEWAHYVFTYDGNTTSVTIAAYKNGALAKAPYTAADGLANCGSMLGIGTQEDYPNMAYVRVFAGAIDDVRVYNRALSSSEIYELYNGLRPSYTDMTPPSVPTNLRATVVSSSRVDLTWTASTDAVGVAGYIIYRGGSPIDTVRSAISYSDINHGVASAFTYTVAPSTTYSYTVAAYDAAYNVSAQTAAVQATTPAYSNTGPYTLTIARIGSSRNVVESLPAGIDCSTTCAASFASGTMVVLTPDYHNWDSGLTPPAFNSWSGAGCSGNGQCYILMDGNKSVTAYYASASADTTPPTVTTFSIPETAGVLTVSITTLTATDNVGVSGYLLAETSTTPLATNPGWTSSIPASYTFSSSGSKTLYAWAKDTAGNISASRNDSVTIAISPAPPRNLRVVF
jgi:hypothetical protein